MGDKLTEFLQRYTSISEFTSNVPAEDYYHGMLNGILAGDPQLSEYKSNFGAGNDCPDIVFLSQDNRTAVIIEIKKADYLADIDEIKALALKQIEEKGYAETYLNTDFVSDVFAYGICFYKNDCKVTGKKLK